MILWLITYTCSLFYRATDNWKFLKELENAIQVYWKAKDRLPPRAVKIDINIERDLAYALKVRECPQLLFLRGNTILYREKDIRTVDELVQMIAHFYYNAKKPSWMVGSGAIGDGNGYGRGAGMEGGIGDSRSSIGAGGAKYAAVLSHGRDSLNSGAGDDLQVGSKVQKIPLGPTGLVTQQSGMVVASAPAVVMNHPNAFPQVLSHVRDSSNPRTNVVCLIGLVQEIPAVPVALVRPDVSVMVARSGSGHIGQMVQGRVMLTSGINMVVSQGGVECSMGDQSRGIMMAGDGITVEEVGRGRAQRFNKRRRWTEKVRGKAPTQSSTQVDVQPACVEDVSGQPSRGRRTSVEVAAGTRLPDLNSLPNPVVEGGITCVDGEFVGPHSVEHDAGIHSQCTPVFGSIEQRHEGAMDGVDPGLPLDESVVRDDLVEKVQQAGSGVSHPQSRGGVAKAAPGRVVITFDDIIRADNTLQE
ncbi:hypothetical protein NE237_005996 [Protea cynaroides]|uniref:Uncharacterized protein n=1 Tax=Protea cynaroides TaxID=273540 RepID=A0A9Q0QV07_9MAGN|nr:hypothetical protein NE237_005996 [Protea cynaroides]